MTHNTIFIKKKKLCIIPFFLLIAAFACIFIYFSKNTTTQTALPKEEPVWAANNHRIIHAAGNIDSYAYTNSKEALDLSLANGHRLIEIDFLFTSDAHLVLRHDFEDETIQDGFVAENGTLPTLETFLNTKIYGKYTPMDIDALLLVMNEYEDLYIVTDTKEKDLSSVLDAITQRAKALGLEHVLDRFVVQFYKYDDYKKLKKQTVFDNFIFTTYKLGKEIKSEGFDKIIAFSVENQIDAVTIPKKYATEETIRLFTENGLTLYTHTINSEKKEANLKDLGIAGIYTDMNNPVNIGISENNVNK